MEIVKKNLCYWYKHVVFVVVNNNNVLNCFLIKETHNQYGGISILFVHITVHIILTSAKF